MSGKLGLREAAAAMTAGPRPTKMSRLLGELGDAERAEVLDLLTGEPRVSARVVARVLTDTFDPPSPITDQDVQRWRDQRRIQ